MANVGPLICPSRVLQHGHVERSTRWREHNGQSRAVGASRSHPSPSRAHRLLSSVSTAWLPLGLSLLGCWRRGHVSVASASCHTACNLVGRTLRCLSSLQNGEQFPWRRSPRRMCLGWALTGTRAISTSIRPATPTSTFNLLGTWIITTCGMGSVSSLKRPALPSAQAPVMLRTAHREMPHGSSVDISPPSTWREAIRSRRRSDHRLDERYEKLAT